VEEIFDGLAIIPFPDSYAERIIAIELIRYLGPLIRVISDSTGTEPPSSFDTTKVLSFGKVWEEKGCQH